MELLAQINPTESEKGTPIMEFAVIIVPFLTATVVAIIGKLQFDKNKDKIGAVPPETNLYKLLSTQGVEIHELREEVDELKAGLKQCKSSERRLLKRLGLEPEESEVEDV